MPRAVSPTGLDLRTRAAALGITLNALKKRESYARRPVKAPRPAKGPQPAPPTWIGARIWPPLEPDHPSLIQPATRKLGR